MEEAEDFKELRVASIADETDEEELRVAIEADGEATEA